MRNPNAFALPYTAVLDTPFRQTVRGTVPPAESGQPGVTFFVTAAQSRGNKVELYANGRWQDLEASSGAQCASTHEAFAAYDLPAANPGAFAPQALTGTPASYQHTIKYDHDGLYRLTSANYCGGYVTDCPAPAAYRAYGYAYDLMGNRTKAQAWQGAANLTSHFTYTYSLANQLTASTNVLTGQTTGYKYDRAGRLMAYGAVSQSPDYTDVTLGWDAENRLTSYSVNGQATTYAYNGYGDRYSQQVDNGAPTFYTLDYNTSLTQVLAETTSGQTTNYLTGIGQQTSAGWQYFNTDGLGSVRQMTDAAGAITYAASYEPYGTPFEQWPNPQAASAFGFTGEPRP
jgi:YD repeat-containing protein